MVYGTDKTFQSIHTQYNSFLCLQKYHFVYSPTMPCNLLSVPSLLIAFFDLNSVSFLTDIYFTHTTHTYTHPWMFPSVLKSSILTASSTPFNFCFVSHEASKPWLIVSYVFLRRKFVNGCKSPIIVFSGSLNFPWTRQKINLPVLEITRLMSRVLHTTPNFTTRFRPMSVNPLAAQVAVLTEGALSWTAAQHSKLISWDDTEAIIEEKKKENGKKRCRAFILEG